MIKVRQLLHAVRLLRSGGPLGDEPLAEVRRDLGLPDPEADDHAQADLLQPA
jgi:hypothetical protein